MPGLELDPLASSGDPLQRLVARVADLEKQVERLSVTRTTLPSRPKAQAYNINAGNLGSNLTYTANGGYCIVLGSGSVEVANSGAAASPVVSLVVDGTTRGSTGFITGDPDPNGPSATPLFAFAAGVWTGDHTVRISMTNQGPSLWDSGSIVVIELPYAG